MNSSAYEQLYTNFVEQQWITPFYVWTARSFVVIGIGLFIFLTHLIVHKAKGLNKEFSIALFYSLLCPTLLSTYVGVVFTPFFILPYDIVWNYGLFRTTLGTHIEFITSSAFCVPYVMSLIFLGIIYMKAFFKTTQLHVSKTLRFIFYASTCGIILIGCILIYSGFGYKQDWKRSIVVDGDPRNEIIFRDYGGFVINMIDAPPTIVIAAVLLVSEGVIAGIIVSVLFIKVIITTHVHRITMSKGTYSLQLMLVRVFVIHIIIFVSLYGLPVTIVIVTIYFQISNLSRYPIGVICMLNLCIMPNIYCLAYLYFVSPIRKAFLRMGGKITTVPSSQITTRAFQTSTGVF